MLDDVCQFYNANQNSDARRLVYGLGLLVCTAMSVLENPNRAMRMIALIVGQGVG